MLKPEQPDLSAMQGTYYGGQAEDASFIVLSESIAGPNPLYNSSNHETKDDDSLDRLFDFLSTKTDINFPMCGDCADTVCAGLKQQYDDTCVERDTYFSFLNKIKDDPEPPSAEVEALRKKIQKLEQENAAAMNKLIEAESEFKNAQKELEAAEQNAAKLADRNKEVYKERNAAELGFLKLETEKNRLQSISQYQSMQLQRLQRTNVYNDVFCIGTDGQIATINGLRLGRLKEKRIEWTEINAAWGQTLLLLASVISRLEISIPQYRLRPLGSMSRIDKIDLDEHGQPTGRASSLELYSRGDAGFPRILMPSKMDAAMLAFLEVLQKVGQFVEAADSSLHIPYFIDKDIIGGYSLMYANTSNKEWTQACRHVLTDARWILSYVSSL